MKSVLLILITCLFSTFSICQDQAMAAQMIEEDYAYLLKSIADINNELSQVNDKNIQRELRSAKGALIEDYINGPFGIFESGKTAVSVSGKNTSIESYLKKLNHKNSNNIDITITDMETSNGDILVSYKLSGLSSKALKLKSKVVSKGADLYISSVKDYSTRLRPTSIAQNNSKPVSHTIAVPEILTRVTSLIDEQIIIQGEIKNHQTNGKLSVRTESFYKQDIELKPNGTFSFSIAQSIIPVQDIVLKYQYGDKFMEQRKNLIVTEGNRLLSDLGPAGSLKDSPEATGGHE